MRLSVVTTLFHSSAHIREFYQRTSAVAAKVADDYEIIFVNDGSPDDSLDVALALYETDKKVKVIDLSRNFGHHKAIMTGLMHAKGDFVFLVDSDLEEEPELLEIFYEEIKKRKVDVVFGVQKKRKGKRFEQFSGEIYYVLFNLLTGFKAARNVLTARLMTQNYVRALSEHKEREFDIMGFWSLTGFKQFPVAVNKLSKGSTVYNLRRKVALMINTITAFSNRPLLAVFFIGVIVFSLSLAAALGFVTRQIFFAESVEGWIIVTISIWLVGGLILTCMGTIGIYISKIHAETKQRPYTIIRKLYDGENIERSQI